MASSYLLWGLFLSLSLYNVIHSYSASTSSVYIVYLGLNQIRDPGLTSKSHLQLLSRVFESVNDAEKSILYSYKYSFSGFSARLNSSQADSLSNMEGVISVFEGRTLEGHTTRSWDFMGLTLHNNGEVTSLQLAYGDDTIVGIFDSGIWPESESFQEEQCMSPIPSSWKGKCVEGENFDPEKACSRKLIGARYYIKGFEETYGILNTSNNQEYRSPRDFLGHGTHTASTAIGSVVKNASFFGLGQGTARGGAPRARLAVYKICWGVFGRCTEADILAAFDDALHDGVHVISASIGSSIPLRPFFASSADIGSFHAMQHGVTVVFSAGNDGPDPSLVQNVAPWSICVAASTIDRTFPTQIVVNGDFSITGESLISTEIKARVAYALNYFFDGVCNMENLIGRSAIGRVVLCFSTVGSIRVEEAASALSMINASALIFAEPITRQFADNGIIPTIRIDISQGTQLRHYIAQFRKLPTVQLKPSKTSIRTTPAPTVSFFSSRGPSSISPDILKPDISAPGVSILAAWPSKTPPTSSPTDTRSTNWNFLSGTSMACPHVSGVVALIKSAHPDWSPAAIKSALVTTAFTRDSSFDSILSGGTMKVSDPFDIGAGHINPLKAMDPGLVYDIKPRDYTLFLCNMGYTQEQIKSIVGNDDDTSCNTSQMEYYKTNTNLNYPSITVSNLQSTITIKRTVRNVGQKKNAIYFASIIKPSGVEVVVWPRILFFSSWFKEEVSYYVTLKPVKKSQGRYDFGEIVWSDGFHYVRSPLVVLVNNTMDSIPTNGYTSI